MRAREIHAAAQKLAGMPLSWNTVKDCLHKNARRPAAWSNVSTTAATGIAERRRCSHRERLHC
jgi:hypothetical protein